MTCVARVICALLTAVAPLSAQRAHAHVQTADDSAATCSILADSLLSLVPREQLPAAKPRGELTLLRTPTDAQLGRAIHSSVLVQPDGRADTTSVVVTGTDDLAYRRDFARAMDRTAFHAPIVNGCRVWGSFWLALGHDGVFRSRP